MTAASIWNMLIPLSVPSEVVMVRSSALIMPLVMVNSSSPSGLPTAYTVSPTAMLSLSPKVTGVTPLASILSRAMSLSSSTPTMVA